MAEESKTKVEPKYELKVRTADEFDAAAYQKVFSDNYRGLTPQAKELTDFIKKRDTGTRTGITYLPWAVEHRAALEQDPFFKAEKVHNADGSFLFYHGKTHEGGRDDACYFVKIAVRFYGKELVEEYPVQDFTFESVAYTPRSVTVSGGKVKEIKMDANIINKSLQRAMAKATAMVTGIGLSIYETGDLQFEEDAESQNAPKVDKKTGEIVAPAIDQSLMIDDEQLKIIEELAKDPATKIRLDKALASYKAASYKDFTKAQATTVIKALTKPATPPVTKVETEKKE